MLNVDHIYLPPKETFGWEIVLLCEKGMNRLVKMGCEPLITLCDTLAATAFTQCIGLELLLYKTPQLFTTGGVAFEKHQESDDRQEH